MVLGQRVRELRKKNKLTQKQLSDLSGVAEITIRQYEGKERHAKTEQLQKIAEVLNTSMDYLLGKTDNPSKPVSKHQSLEEFLASEGITSEKNIAALKEIMDLMAKNEHNAKLEISDEFLEKSNRAN